MAVTRWLQLRPMMGCGSLIGSWFLIEGETKILNKVEDGKTRTLTDALCKEIGPHELNLQSKVLEMSYNCDGNAVGNWSICCAPDQNKQFQQSFNAVIMTAPLGNVKEMKITKIGSPFPLNFIPEVSYMPISVIISTFKKENVKQLLEGFGVLVPDKEQKNGLRTLALAGKPAGIFWSTGFHGGGQELTTLTAITQLAHHGTLFVPLGYTFGSGMFEIDDINLMT
uniref:Putative amine oxidase n=1 Tax=Helianthus annuus TaxID=4232 RepID=A0A251T6D3_HELAN